MVNKKRTMAGNITDRQLTNGLIKQLNAVVERDESHAVTYLGVTVKSAYFLLMMVVGFVVYEIVSADVKAMTEAGSLGLVMVVGVLLSLILMIAAPLLAFRVRALVPVLGTLFCLSSGYLVAFLTGLAPEKYIYLAWLAAALTVLLVFAMAVLYMSGIVKVTQRFKTIVCALFFTGILLSILMFAARMIPALSGFVNNLKNNMILSIGGSIVFIIVACMMLIVDFDSIHSAVEKQLPKEYEWTAAFALVYTVIYLYLRLFTLLKKVKGNK